MPSMYDAMMAAAKVNPEWQKKLTDAKTKMEEDRIRDEEERRLIEERRQLQKAERLAAENARREEERLKKERENMSTLRPFSYVYQHCGSYSAAAGIILALSLDEATEKMKGILMSDEFHGPGSMDPKSFEELKLRVEPIDLSRGWCGIFDVIE